MPLTADHFAINPLQWVATSDGWIDPTLAPALRERLTVIRDAGFGAIQTEVPRDMTPAQYSAVLAEYGVRPGPGYVNMPWSEDAVERRRHLDRARGLTVQNVEAGTPLMFLAMGMARNAERVLRPAVGHAADESHLNRVRDYLAEAAVVITAEGGTAALHPHIGTWVETLDEARFVLDSTDADTLKFGPDTGHLAWTGADPTVAIGEYAERIGGIHIKDLHHETARRSRDEKIDYRATVLAGLWTEPGRGDADLDGILNSLRPDFDGWVVIEVDRASTDPKESVAASGRWLAEYLG
ncbi:sugar phosphate isomerase/epimerase family protein [Arthrobacter sp. MMS18-M83]|uniref:sugar phosphate isomerase/epimerase family protein n=1 Tax=Arthrobacter sp. MMS18-M83 TaxID=2996261 RepID=UPI00227B8DB8|nr:sugar phosphate isomerase/epimerase [Arthrobacter sp. MMS18-M83]WAH97448.1 sugar phosphate isomerase/epimerase [Arthrobacter sp. MMS18-M83]